MKVTFKLETTAPKIKKKRHRKAKPVQEEEEEYFYDTDDEPEEEYIYEDEEYLTEEDIYGPDYDDIDEDDEDYIDDDDSDIDEFFPEDDEEYEEYEEEDEEDEEEDKELNHRLKLEVGKYILALTKKYAPVRTGYMRDHIVLLDDDEGIRIVSFAPYSIFVHEILTNRHKEPTKAKFLEDAAYEIYNASEGAFEVSIEYTPLLQVFIDSDRGINIAKKKKKEKEDIESLFRNFRSW